MTVWRNVLSTVLSGCTLAGEGEEMVVSIAPLASCFDTKDDQATSSVVQQFWMASFHALVTCLEQVGLKLNASKAENTRATIFDTDFACKIGTKRFGANKIAQMAWLPFITGQHTQSTTRC